MNLAGKRLLILGANPETAGLVKKANELGITTYVTDYDPSAYAKRFATHPENIDASHVDELYDLVCSECIDGVLVGVAEKLLSPYAELCRRLNFPCFGTSDVFDLMTDKFRFKNVCRTYGVPVVSEYTVEDYSDTEKLKNIPLPVVVKPADSCSSKGISVCHTFSELKYGIEKALSFSEGKKLLVEKYMTCEEAVIYYVIQNGNPSCVAVCDRYTNKDQVGVAQLPTAYIFPSCYTESYSAEVDANVKKMLRGIGIQNGTLFIQSFVENGKFYFYESGFRLNGAQEHYIVSALGGIDVKELLVHFALTGRMADFDITKSVCPQFSKMGCKYSPLVRTGHIAKLYGLERIEKLPGIISVNPSYDEGDVVDGYGTLKQIIARFFVVRNTKEELKETIDAINGELVVLDDEGKSMLLKSFDTNLITKLY